MPSVNTESPLSGEPESPASWGRWPPYPSTAPPCPYFLPSSRPCSLRGASQMDASTFRRSESNTATADLSSKVLHTTGHCLLTPPQDRGRAHSRPRQDSLMALGALAASRGLDGRRSAAVRPGQELTSLTAICPGGWLLPSSATAGHSGAQPALCVFLSGHSEREWVSLTAVYGRQKERPFLRNFCSPLPYPCSRANYPL